MRGGKPSNETAAQHSPACLAKSSTKKSTTVVLPQSCGALSAIATARGVLVGGLVGSLDDSLDGAFVGALVGVLVGALVGTLVDARARRRARSSARFVGALVGAFGSVACLSV